MFRNKCAQKAVQMACIPARDRSLSAMTHLSHPRLYTCHLVQSDWQSLDKLLLNTYFCAPIQWTTQRNPSLPRVKTRRTLLAKASRVPHSTLARRR